MKGYRHLSCGAAVSSCPAGDLLRHSVNEGVCVLLRQACHPKLQRRIRILASIMPPPPPPDTSTASHIPALASVWLREMGSWMCRVCLGSVLPRALIEVPFQDVVLYNFFLCIILPALKTCPRVCSKRGRAGASNVCQLFALMEIVTSVS